jgi:hypothetical protein
MPTSAVATNILGDFRRELQTLQSTPFSEQPNPVNMLGSAAAGSILRRMKRPLHQRLTWWQADSDLAALISLLDRLQEVGFSAGNRPAPNPQGVQDIHARKYWTSRWADIQVKSLRRQTLVRSRPADLVRDGIRTIAAVIPDWYWRLSPGDGESPHPISEPLLDQESRRHSFSRARMEAMRRLGNEFGVRLSHNETYLWFAWHNGLQAHPFGREDEPARAAAQLCLNRLWWAEAAKLQARDGCRPELRPVVPALSHDFTGHPVSWIGFRPGDDYDPQVEFVLVDIQPSRRNLPVVGDTVQLPRQRQGEIREADYYENNDGYIVRAALTVWCPPDPPDFEPEF